MFYYFLVIIAGLIFIQTDIFEGVYKNSEYSPASATFSIQLCFNSNGFGPKTPPLQ